LENLENSDEDFSYRRDINETRKDLDPSSQFHKYYPDTLSSISVKTKLRIYPPCNETIEFL